MGTVVRRKVFIDGDWIVYAAGFAGQKTKYVYTGIRPVEEHESLTEVKDKCEVLGHEFDPSQLYSRIDVDPPAHVYHSAKLMIEKAIKQIQERYPSHPLDVHVFIDGDGNYRHKIATIRPYKGTRVAPRPVMYHDLRKYLVQHWNAKTVFDQETDDTLSICAHTVLEDQKGGTPYPVIVGIDKDFLQIPCIHYNPNKGFVTISPPLGETLVYRQCLTGDTVDNIMGCPGIGPVKAKALITPDMTTLAKWNRVIDAYTAAHTKDPDCFGGATPEEAAEENMQLVWLRTRPGELWTPETHVYVRSEPGKERDAA